MQTIWKGTIAFGLVSIPVRLVSAIEEKDVSFRQVHADDGGRVRFKRICSLDEEEVAFTDIAKGYELPDGDIVVLTDTDLANVPVASSRVIEVQRFVPAEQIDPASLRKPYYCEPTGPDPKPYVLLQEALSRSGRVAVVKVSLRQRERMATLRAHGGMLVLQTMLWPDEIREPDFPFLNQDVALRSQEIAMAESYVQTLAEDFVPEDYVDEYRAALQRLIEAKVAGHDVTVPAPPTPREEPGLDLLETLRRSVEAARGQAQEQAGGGGDAAEGADGGKPAGGARASRARGKAAPTQAAPAKARARRTTVGTPAAPARKKPRKTTASSD